METLLKKMVELDFLNKEQAVDIILEYQEKSVSMGHFLKQKQLLSSESILAIIERQKESHQNFKQTAIELNLWKDQFEIEYSKFLIASGLSLSKMLINKKIISAEELVKIFDEEVEGFVFSPIEKEVSNLPEKINNESEATDTLEATHVESTDLSIDDSPVEKSLNAEETVSQEENIESNLQASEIEPEVSNLSDIESEIINNLENAPKFKDQYNEHFQEDLLFKIENLNTWGNLDSISRKVLLEIILENFNQIRKISQSAKMFSIEEFAFLIASSFNIFVEHPEKMSESITAEIQKKLTISAQMLWDLRLAAVASDKVESDPELNETYLFFIQDFSTFCDDFMKVQT